MSRKPKRGNIQHIEINVSDLTKSKGFYEDLLAWVGYKRILDEKEVAGWGNGMVQIFLVKCEKGFSKPRFHRKRVGLNHIAFRAKSREDVNEFHKHFLIPKRVRVLYGARNVIRNMGRTIIRCTSKTPTESNLSSYTGSRRIPAQKSREAVKSARKKAS